MSTDVTLMELTKNLVTQNRWNDKAVNMLGLGEVVSNVAIQYHCELPAGSTVDVEFLYPEYPCCCSMAALS